jgi:dipeptidyl aminopeptidase/acylaminoacyl peptidase
MRRSLPWRIPALLVCLVVLVHVAVSAQAPAAGKRPLSYKEVDYWHAIQAPRLSADGQWLSYAVTSQAEDGELIVRNLASGQEYRHPRGTGAQFTQDGKFLVFTIAQPKADEEKERLNEAAQAPSTGSGQGQAGGEGRAAGGGAAAASGSGQGGRGAQAARNQPRTNLGIMTLADGKVTVIEKVGSFQLPEESSAWLAYYKGVGGAGGGGRGGAGGRGAGGAGGRGGAGAPPAAPAAAPATTGRGAAASGAQAGGRGGTNEKRKDSGSDLILRNLATSEDVTIADVTEYSFDTKGTWLAYATSSSDAAKDGAFLRHLPDGAVTTLMAGRGHYKSLAFDEAGQQVAFLSDKAEYEKPVSPYRIYYWNAAGTAKAPPAAAPKGATPKGATQKPAVEKAAPAAPDQAAPATPDGAAAELVSAATAGMPAGMVVADSFGPRFSRDGLRLFLATGKPPAPPADPNDKTPAPTNVDVWYSMDPLIQPMQKVRAEQERSRTYRAVVQLAERKLVPLATPELPTVNQGEDAARAIGTSDLKYRMEVSWDQAYNDVYLVDLKTGKPQPILEHWGSAGTALSPGGKYVLYFDERTGHWFTYRIADGVRTNLTEKISVRFQQSNDVPDLPGPYGTAGWTANDQSVLLYDEFDIWEIKPDGTSPRMVTGGEGRKQGLILRYRSLDPEERIVPANKPLLLAATDDRTRATGFYRVPLAGTSAPEKLVMMDKAFGAPTKAAKADVVVFTLSRFEEFPDLWVSDTSFRDPKKVSNANPQQAEFVWGRSEIIEYANADGKKLRAILTKPDNFDPSKKYPLMVYIYEELTQGLHSYSAPNVGTSINITRYVSNGYVLLRPDITYATGYPGESSEKCVIPAVQTVVAMGFIDPKRIGIQGHSWGGYQITHLITRTDIFAAVEAGASVSNMISAYGGIRWGTGMVRQFQYEKTQSRIGAPPWDAPLQFIENSPIFWVKKINTPYLTIHNDADDAVPWYQGIEFNMALRRLGKEAYMFSYNGEPHGLRNRDNMKHWTVHMDEFFDHYLLGKPRPEWMDKGVPYLERGRRDVAPMFKR